MFKPILFSSLYALAGVSGWGAYSAISNQDTSIDSLTAIAKHTNHQIAHSVQQDNKPVYRYKDENGNWVYSNTAFETQASSNYEQELNFLKSLPQEAMPTQNFKTSPELAVAVSEAIKDESKLSLLMQEAHKVVKMLEDRNKLLDSIGKGEADNTH